MGDKIVTCGQSTMSGELQSRQDANRLSRCMNALRSTLKLPCSNSRPPDLLPVRPYPAGSVTVRCPYAARHTRYGIGASTTLATLSL